MTDQGKVLATVKIEELNGDLVFTVPDNVRTALGIDIGDEIEWEVYEGQLYMKKAAGLPPLDNNPKKG